VAFTAESYLQSLREIVAGLTTWVRKDDSTLRNSLASARAISPAASRIASYGRSIARGVVSVLSVLLAAGTVACSAAPAATQPLPPAHATGQPAPAPAIAEPAATPPLTEELAAPAASSSTAVTELDATSASAPLPATSEASSTTVVPDVAAGPDATALTDTPEAAPSTATPELPESPVVAVPTVAIGPDLRSLPNPNTVAVPPAGACRIVGGLPDHTCTPGLLNPRLNPAQLCARGFSTRTIRPPTSYTDVLKRRLMAAYGQVGPNPLTGRLWSPNDVELDHAVSLEDLGHPWSPLNLWPQPRRSSGVEPNAEEKDQVEVTVHELICADQSNAATYAARLAADWTQFRRARAPAVAPKESEP